MLLKNSHQLVQIHTIIIAKLPFRLYLSTYFFSISKTICLLVLNRTTRNMRKNSKERAEQMVGVAYHSLKNSYDLCAKILILGDEGVGKSSLVLRFTEDTFALSYVPTIGIDFKSRVVQVGKNRVKMEVWDTAGQQRFNNLNQAYYRNAQAIILSFSLTSSASFQNVQRWIESVSEGVSEKCPMVLVGTKSDLEEGRKVQRGRAQVLSQQLGVFYFEVSAKQSVGVQQCFMYVCQSVCERKLQRRKELRGSKLSSLLMEQQKKSKKGCGC